ncbi:MAG: ATP synthase F1 subunit epsilon [Planctomycetota bacterium]|nr:ATP synthase F1 subunit epsilon [Planctomycetota bacterium]
MVDALAKEIAGDKIVVCVVVTPEKTVLDHPAEFVALPLFDGELGVYPGRAPLIGRLGYGELRMVEGGRTKRFYVDGGFVQVGDNRVTVLTNRAVPADELDESAATEQLAAARQKPATTLELMAIRDRAVMEARGQLRVARKAK